jgi:tRNA threonylcarbamoyl adenosine modification protein YeaZ
MHPKKLLLALDSSSSNPSFTVVDEENSQVILDWHSESKSSQLLGILIEEFEKKDLEAKKISKILVSRGPGSFTGIRTALSITKLLSKQLKIPVLSTNNFELIRFEQGLGKEEPFKIPAAKNDYFVSLNSDYDNLNKNFFISEKDYELNESIKKIDLRKIQSLSSSRLLVDYFKPLVFHLANSQKTYSLEPYYLREASLGKKKI